MAIKGHPVGAAMSLKTGILVSLCLQNAGYTLLRKYSTKYENVSSKEILFVSEVIKLVFSLYMVLNNAPGVNGGLPEERSDAPGTGLTKISWLLRNSQKMLVLAVIYGVMNILSFVALQHIGAGEFTICAQLKILTTAASSVLVLRTSLSWAKWRALVLLVLGCILVASPSFAQGSSGAEREVSLAGQLYGYGAVLTEVVLSGFASTYFEKVVKSTTEVITIWERNFQLGVYSLLMYAAIMLYENGFSVQEDALSAVPERAAWSNWSAVTLTVAVLGATGGLLVAATLKYADSILKTLAAAGAIVLSTVLGHYFLDGPLDLVVSIGALVTIVSIANYTFDSSSV